MRMWKSYEARRLECTARSAPITPVTRRPRESACGVGRAAPADVCAVGWLESARAVYRLSNLRPSSRSSLII